MSGRRIKRRAKAAKPRSRSGATKGSTGGGGSPSVSVFLGTTTGAFAWASGAVTATALSVGSVSAGRLIVAIITSRADADLTAVTIGGVAAVKACGIRNTTATPDTSVEIWYAQASGVGAVSLVATTSDVATTTNVGITIFSLTGGVAGSPTFDTNNTTSGALDGAGLGTAFSVTRNSIVLVGVCGLTGVGPVTWTNVTKYSDINPGTSQTHSTAYQLISLGQTITPNAVSTGSSANSAFAEASFR